MIDDRPGKRIVVVGGGAAGLELVTKLGSHYRRTPHRITLVDRSRTHIWKPLLHEVATGSLDANLDEVDYRSHAYRWGYHYVDGLLAGLNRSTKEVHLASVLDGQGREVVGPISLPYDHLVLAYGSMTNDFGTPGVAENCFVLDDRIEADRFRDQLLNQCLRVSRLVAIEPGSDARVGVTIVGGGATGVELAAELFNAADALQRYGLEGFDRHRLNVTLLEAGPRILPQLPERLARAVQSELEELGVLVRTSIAVIESTPEGMQTASGELIPANLQVWAAGVRANTVRSGLDGLRLARSDQVLVRPTLQSESDSDIFAIGDCAFCRLPGRDQAVPPRAQAAHQMADSCFENLNRLLSSRPLRDFVYKDHGSLVSLSRFSTVGTLMGNLIGGRMAVEGRLARVIYRSLYRMHLLAIHGWLKGAALILVGHVNRVVRPRLKLH